MLYPTWASCYHAHVLVIVFKVVSLRELCPTLSPHSPATPPWPASFPTSWNFPPRPQNRRIFWHRWCVTGRIDVPCTGRRSSRKQLENGNLMLECELPMLQVRKGLNYQMILAMAGCWFLAFAPVNFDSEWQQHRPHSYSVSGLNSDMDNLLDLYKQRIGLYGEIGKGYCTIRARSLLEQAALKLEKNTVSNRDSNWHLCFRIVLAFVSLVFPSLQSPHLEVQSN